MTIPYNCPSCGKIKSRRSSNCRGCQREQSALPIGTVYGNLTIRSAPVKTDEPGSFYDCQCTCGKWRRVKRRYLVCGFVKGCYTCSSSARGCQNGIVAQNNRSPLNPLQAILYKALLNRPVQSDASNQDVEREAYAIALVSKDPLADFNLFFPKYQLEVKRGCSLDNSNHPNRGHRRGQVASRIGG